MAYNDWDNRAGLRDYVQFNKHTHTQTHTLNIVMFIIDPPWENQCEWHRITTMTGPDCVFMCNLINTHRQLRSQGPVSVQAHRIEGVTGFKSQEGANGVGVRIGVGGGNGDGHGVGGGNGNMKTVMGTGTERERERERGWR